MGVLLAYALKPPDGIWADTENSLAYKRGGRAVTLLDPSPKDPIGCGLVGVLGVVCGF